MIMPTTDESVLANGATLKSTGMSKLQMTLMVVVGASLVGNAFVSFSHIYGSDNGHQLPIHSAMKDFKNGKSINRKQVDPYTNPISISKSNAANRNEDGELRRKQLDNSDIARLSCEKYGGPPDEFAQEMVYWEDIPSDARYVSPFKQKHRSQRRYMTFEPDGGGWNNIRMAMETVVGLAIGMGRTLVLPPQKKMYLLGKQDSKQKHHFDFDDFFPMRQMAAENAAIDMITMQEFLETEAMTGNLRDVNGSVSFPPYNRTDWNGLSGKEYDELREWLRTVALVPLWRPGQCLATFPKNGDYKSIEEMRQMQNEIHKNGVNSDVYKGNPVPVDAPPLERMKENLSNRKDLCIYNQSMQEKLVIHFACYHKMKLRLLVHFYAFLFMEDWREDLWMKRFMRDHMRYIDEIQCAAARVVKAMRQIAREAHPTGNRLGYYSSFHVRRGDFQFKDTRIEAEDIYKNSREQLEPNSTIFIATDERDKSFFDSLKKHYQIYFLDDFKDILGPVNTNYYGMIDQLVASKGQVFFGCWHSSFTGFINRMRGYHSVKNKLPGHEQGILPTSYYYATLNRKFTMHEYTPLSGAFFAREFPTSWRDIDKGVGELSMAIGKT